MAVGRWARRAVCLLHPLHLEVALCICACCHLRFIGPLLLRWPAAAAAAPQRPRSVQAGGGGALCRAQRMQLPHVLRQRLLLQGHACSRRAYVCCLRICNSTAHARMRVALVKQRSCGSCNAQQLMCWSRDPLSITHLARAPALLRVWLLRMRHGWLLPAHRPLQLPCGATTCTAFCCMLSCNFNNTRRRRAPCAPAARLPVVQQAAAASGGGSRVSNRSRQALLLQRVHRVC